MYLNADTASLPLQASLPRPCGPLLRLSSVDADSISLGTEPRLHINQVLAGHCYPLYKLGASLHCTPISATLHRNQVYEPYRFAVTFGGDSKEEVGPGLQTFFLHYTSKQSEHR